MSNTSHKLSFLLCLCGFLLVANPQNAEAFFLPPGPFSITVDIPTDACMTIDYGVQALNNAASFTTKVGQEAATKIKSSKEMLAGEVEGFMPSKKDKNKKEKAISGSKKISACKIANVEKPSSVKKAFYKLFLAYPSADDYEMAAYRKKATEFYQDTIIETYVASRELEKELDQLEKNFADLSPRLVEGKGGNGAETGNDNNGTWKNAYTAYDTMNQLLKITEELTAMRAQLEAARAVRHYISPAPYKQKIKKSSLREERGGFQWASRSVRRGGENLAFAQVDFNNFQKFSADSKPTINSNGGASVTSFAQKRSAAALEASRREAIGIITGQNTNSKAASQNTALEDDNYEYDPQTDSSVKYMRAPTPDISSPFKGNEEKMDELDKLDSLYAKLTKALELHNLLQALPSHKETAEKYHRYKLLHEKSVERLRASDKCVLQFLDRYYTNPEKVWTGGPISDDNVANYDLRSGISGWAIKAFEIAKAERTSAVDSDDSVFAEIDVVDSADMSQRGEQESAFKEKAQRSSSPSEEEKVAAINRETELIAWKIGAEAAKKLAEDQYASNPRWGTVRTRFPIWNDQKNFYNQYIDVKYDHIKEYLAALQFNQVSLKIAQELNNLLTEDPDVKAYNARELGRLASAIGGEATSEDENSASSFAAPLISQKQSDLSKAAEQRRQALDALDKQKQKLNQDIGEASKILSGYNEQINELKKSRLMAQSAQEDMQTQLEIADDVAQYAKKNGEETESASAEQQYAKEGIKENQKKEAATEPEIARYQNLAQEQENKIEQLKNQLSQVEKQISAVEEAYTKQVQKLEQKYASAIEENSKKLQDSKAVKAAQTLLAFYRENVEQTFVGDLIGTASVKGIISQAEGLIDDTKSYAIQAVEAARADLYKLGDDLYLPNSSPMVVKRHAELMTELQNIPIDKLVASSSALGKIGSNTAITSALSTLFQQIVTQKACADGRCGQPDTKYFIGFAPKDKDFSAPKAAPEIYLAPPREIVRFDTINYENISQMADGTVSRQGFLNYGEEIPAIWQKILQEDIFVEHAVDLPAILNAGSGRESAFMRGGRYPCRLDEKIVDIDPYDGQYMIVSELTDDSKTDGLLKKFGSYAENNLPQCQEIEIITNAGLASKFYYTLRDIEANTEGPAAVQAKEALGNPSELGTLLKAQDGGGLRFADKPIEVFERLNEIAVEWQGNSSGKYQTNLKDEIFNNAPYNVNQIGDFLDYVEVETSYRQMLEELKASCDELNNMLKEQLTAAGFTPTAEFDLSKDEDYGLARNSLDYQKNKLIEEGFSGISDVKVSDNEVVEERLNKIKRTFTALRKDKDELLSLNENSPSDSELDEQIKIEEVNKTVVGEYDKKVEEEFQKQLNNFKLPFCAAY